MIATQDQSLHLPCDLLSAMELLAEGNGQTLEETIADAMLAYLLQCGKKSPEAQQLLMKYLKQKLAVAK